MIDGKTIQLFLMDGSVTGIRYAELVNWTGVTVITPRARIPELSDRIDELPVGKPTGIYFLFGPGEQPTVYVGASTDILSRLQTHFKNDDLAFWNDAVFFTSKGQNLTRAHAEFLEARAIGRANEVGRCELENSQYPAPPDLAPAQRAPMQDFFTNMQLVLGALGYRILQPLTESRIPDESKTIGGRTGKERDDGLVGRLFKFGVGEAHATGQMTDEGFVVLEDSTARPEPTDSCQETYRRLREELKNSGKLEPNEESLRFTQDVLFDSPSAAACAVAGGNRSGPREWTDPETDQRLLDIEDELGDQMG